jgi:hypothetical protein
VTVTDSKNRSDTSKAIAQIGLAPDKPNITGPTKGKARVLYNYSVVAVDPDGDDVYYDIDWNDMTGEWDCGPYPSGEEIVFKHGFWYPDIYTISVRAKDDAGLESDWVDLEVYMPRDKSISSSPLLRFLERYPLLNRLLNLVNNNCFRK